LNNAFEGWKGQNPQTDDVLVLGWRVKGWTRLGESIFTQIGHRIAVVLFNPLAFRFPIDSPLRKHGLRPPQNPLETRFA
jgi:hypothetical protein